MKPKTERTYIDQCLTNEHGITWLDNCRIPYKDDNDIKETTRWVSDKKHTHFNQGVRTPFKPDKRGRFPANLLVSDDSLNNGKEYKSGGNKNYKIARGGVKGGEFLKNLNKLGYKTPAYSDKGSYSRYFDLDGWLAIIPKPSPKEKNYGLDTNPINNNDNYNGKFPNSKADKNNKNKHPTVKPIKLMSYLITLGSRPDQIVLDPFMGSGTTGIAAKILNRKFIGYELEPE